MSRLLAIARKELWQLMRDRLTLGMMVMLPVVQLLLFGYAINTDVRHMPTGRVRPGPLGCARATWSGAWSRPATTTSSVRSAATRRSPWPCAGARPTSAW